MPYIREFGAYIPERVVSNEEIGGLVGCTAEWIWNVSGIQQRRFAAVDETVASMAASAAKDCLERAALKASDLGLLIVSSGSSERRFPGPAALVAQHLGLNSTPAIDIPVASAGAIFGLALADRLSPSFGNVLVVAAEKMSSVVVREPLQRSVSILFGDGAGACLVSPEHGLARIVGSGLHTDGSFSEDLFLPLEGQLEMNGRTVILQVTRKLPRALRDLIEAHGRRPSDVDVFLLHQANSNLITRVAQALEVPETRFYNNICRYGNTSSASMLIAAAEWHRGHGFRSGFPVAFGGFGAGFHWGAVLAVGV